MEHITFNGLGEPSDPTITSGRVAVLVQPGAVKVVRIELVPPDEFGPFLHHATNGAQINRRAAEAVEAAFPEGLSPDRDYVLTCPADIAADARFPD